jgi:hypothetical protein
VAFGPCLNGAWGLTWRFAIAEMAPWSVTARIPAHNQQDDDEQDENDGDGQHDLDPPRSRRG